MKSRNDLGRSVKVVQLAMWEFDKDKNVFGTVWIEWERYCVLRTTENVNGEGRFYGVGK